MKLGRLTLSRQLFVLQALIILAVLGAVVVITFVQSTSDFQRSTGNRMLSQAETLATDPLIRQGLRGEVSEGAIAPTTARTQSVSGTDLVVVLDSDGVVVASQTPSDLDRRWLFGSSDVLEGRAWTGSLDLRDGSGSVQAHVPVLDPANGDTLGYVVIGREYPTLTERLVASVPDLLIYLGVASALGLTGSLLLARRIKRQTLGLEPRDIAGLVEHREALLRGIKEGVIGLDLDHRVTIVNSEAIDLLDLPGPVDGQRIDELSLSSDVARALTTDRPVRDELIDTGRRIVVLNRLPVRNRGRVIGSVATLRDRTELWGLRAELDHTRHTADALRAQTHEFSNRLHTIAGLMRLGHVDRAQDYVTHVHAVHNKFLAEVTSRIADPTLAALVIAKGSLASERNVELRISDNTSVGPLELELATDVETILGNFVDNAFEACSGLPEAWVEVEVSDTGNIVLIQVRDSGPGVAQDVLASVFTRGVTTKSVDPGGHGIGLALADAVCRRRGGSVDVHNDAGAVFTATFPRPQRPQGPLPAQDRSSGVSQVTVGRTHLEGDS